MKVLELLDEIEEIVDTSSSFPLTGKILVDAEEILEIVREIRVELPDEMQQAQWIKNERQRILDEAKQEYDKVLGDAKQQAEALIEDDDITIRAKARADELMQACETNMNNLKVGTFEYIDGMLYDMQEKMDHLNATYVTDLFQSLQNTFDEVGATLADNRNEIKDMLYKVQENLEK